MNMQELKELLKEINKFNTKKEEEKKTTVGKLKHKILSNLTDDECIELQEEVCKFLQNSDDEKAKEELRRYTEMLAMRCSCIKKR